MECMYCWMSVELNSSGEGPKPSSTCASPPMTHQSSPDQCQKSSMKNENLRKVEMDGSRSSSSMPPDGFESLVSLSTRTTLTRRMTRIVVSAARIPSSGSKAHEASMKRPTRSIGKAAASASTKNQERK